jgi:DNA polymerase-3 subunit beta
MNIIIKPAAKKIKFQLKCIASEKYPEFPAFNKEKLFEMPVKEFKEMVLQTVFAVSDDETRYFMNGVFFEKTDKNIIMVATDGRRLAYTGKTVDKGIKDFAGVIVPPKILNTIIKRAGNEGLVSVSVTDKTLYVRIGSYSLSSVLLEGQFPNYRKVIPETQSHSLTVKRLEIMDALRRVSLMVEAKSHRVYLGLAPGVMSVYSEESEIGTAKEDIPCQYDGAELSIALNYRYIEDPLKVITDDEICIRFTEPNKAITILPVPEKDFFHIIMPMQTD